MKSKETNNLSALESLIVIAIVLPLAIVVFSFGLNVINKKSDEIVEYCSQNEYACQYHTRYERYTHSYCHDSNVVHSESDYEKCMSY